LSIDRKPLAFHIASAIVAGLVLMLAVVPPSVADDDPEAHEEAVTKLVMERNINVPYAYIDTLMRLPNAFGEGAACVICHGSTNSEHSYRGLDLTSCAGLIRGATEKPARAIIFPGDSHGSRLRRHLQDNRMPFGVPFDYPTDTTNIQALRQWIDDGAKNDERFNQKVLPLFSQEEAFGIETSCASCHPSSDRESERELDMTSYTGIMLGAESVTRERKGLPPRRIVVPGDAAASPLYQRLVENRMPAGIDPTESPNHPNTALLVRWIDQGARCD
jgi:cytochrome c553